MNTIVEVTELEMMNCRVGVTAQVRKRVRVMGYGEQRRGMQVHNLGAV